MRASSRSVAGRARLPARGTPSLRRAEPRSPRRLHPPAHSCTRQPRASPSADEGCRSRSLGRSAKCPTRPCRADSARSASLRPTLARRTRRRTSTSSTSCKRATRARARVRRRPRTPASSRAQRPTRGGATAHLEVRKLWTRHRRWPRRRQLAHPPPASTALQPAAARRLDRSRAGLRLPAAAQGARDRATGGTASAGETRIARHGMVFSRHREPSANVTRVARALQRTMVFGWLLAVRPSRRVLATQSQRVRVRRAHI